MEYAFVRERLEGIHDRMAAACDRSGRKREDVVVMAVSKFHPVEAIEAAYECGIRRFGENRVQEALGKFPGFLARHPDARLDMIGHLQSNKAKKVLGLASCVQSVDSTDLLVELGMRAQATPASLDVLFELHTGEDSKSGFPDSVSMLEALDILSKFPMLRLRGLMTMAPFVQDAERIRSSFKALRNAYRVIETRLKDPLFDTISMGMSNDFEIAIEEGSTLVRIGTALFGERSHDTVGPGDAK